MRIKTVFNEDIRVHAFDSEDDVTIDALSGAIGKSYKIVRPFSLTYEDTDGDVITIESNEDLKVALEDAQKILKIRVKKDVSKESTEKPKEVTVEICDPNAPESDDEEETEFEIEEKTTTDVEGADENENENEDEDDGEPQGEQNVYEVYCDDLLDNEELQKEIAATIKFALGRLREGDNIQVAVETALAAHEMVANHPLIQKALPKLPTFAVKAQMWVPMAVNIEDTQVDMFFQMIIAKLRALRNGSTDGCPDFSFLQRHPLFGNIFSQFDAYTEPREDGGSDVHVKVQQKELIHKLVACDGCNAEPITGVRFKCTVCPNYDLCENCEDKHDPTHPLIKMNVTMEDFNSRPVGLREFLRQTGGGRHCHRGGFGRTRGGGRFGRGGFGRRWMKFMQQQIQQNQHQLFNENDNSDNENETPFNPDGSMFNPFDFMMFSGRQGGCFRRGGRGGRGRGRKCGGRGKCHGKGKGKCGKKEGKRNGGKPCKGGKKQHCRREKQQNKGPADYDAKLIRHMNLEDDTPVGEGILVKTWRVKNIGLKTWNKGDVAVVYDGKPFNHLVDGARFDVAGPVENGQEVDISVVLNVPEGFNGNSLVKYRLKCGDIKFGPPLKVKIRVVGDEIHDISKWKNGKHGLKGKGNEQKKLKKAEKQLEKLEKQKLKLEQKAEMISARIEKFQQQMDENKDTETQENLENKQNKHNQTESVGDVNDGEDSSDHNSDEEMKEEPPVETVETVEEVHSSSSFEIVDEEEEESDLEGYSYDDFSNAWDKRHLRKTSEKSIMRAFIGLKPNEDGVVEPQVVEKFFDEFTKLSKPVVQKEGSEESDSVLVEEEEEENEMPQSEEEDKPKEKEFVEPKPFPYQNEVEMLTAMGFNEDVVKDMLESHSGNVQAVLNQILG